MSVTLIVPFYKFEPKNQEWLDTLLKTQNLADEILVIDNGSVVPLVVEESSRPSNVRVVRLDRNIGWGGAVSFGARQAASSDVCWVPSNGKVAPEDLKKFLSIKVEDGILLKARRQRRTSFFKAKAWLAGLAHSLLMGVNMTDSGGTPTRCSRTLFLENGPYSGGPEFDAHVLLKLTRNGVTAIRPNVRYADPEIQASSWRGGLGSEVLLFLKILKLSRN